ncbi:MAG: hypothetical protein K2M42_08620 [Oscillospiraceae bacterium]|nr:hypothetical protein [Oscillospiraceae bacterium]
METTRNVLNNFIESVVFSEVNDEDDLGYQDPFVTLEQKKRDKQITELLSEYVKAYKKKVFHSSICRYIILVPCMLIICLFAGILIYFSMQMVGSTSQIEVPDIVSFVTACISFISLIIGLLTIITKYFFPENDEQYITAIVEAIQKNDLENKRENAKYQEKKTSPSG